jgi:dipeptidyl aminopeptidase/acylaminoacyl peptidase
MLFNPVVIVAPVEGVWEMPTQMRDRMDAPLVDLSPFHHVAGDAPPTLIVHGTDDEVVPFPTVVAYCQRVTELGGECEVVPYEGAGHGFFNRDPHYQLTLQQALRFLDSLGWI